MTNEKVVYGLRVRLMTSDWNDWMNVDRWTLISLSCPYPIQTKH